MAEAPTVLLVEDNDDNLRIYSTILNYAGYHVLEATDGEAGLASARTDQPDLILMDVSIPKRDGFGSDELRACRDAAMQPRTASRGLGCADDGVDRAAGLSCALRRAPRA